MSEQDQLTQYKDLRAYLQQNSGNEVNLDNSGNSEYLKYFPAARETVVLDKTLVESELRRAELQKQYLKEERQSVEQEYNKRQAALEAEIELARKKLEQYVPKSEQDQVFVIPNTPVSSPSAPGTSCNDNASLPSFVSSAPPLGSVEPSALEALSSVDKVSVRQLQPRPSSLDETYEVLSPAGDVILRANLTFSVSDIMLLGMKRALRLDVYDNQSREIMNFRPGHDNTMEVYVGGRLAGLVRRRPTLLGGSLVLYDHLKRPMLKVKENYAYLKQPSTSVNVTTVNKVCIGQIEKKPNESVPAGYEPRNHAELTFPLQLDVRCKATLLATSFLIVHNSYSEVRHDKIQSVLLDALTNYVKA